MSRASKGDEKLAENEDAKTERISKIVPLANFSTPELVQRWKSGDEGAAEVLYQRYSYRLVALVANRTRGARRATIDHEGVVQSALASFFNSAAESRVHVTNSIALWNLLAVFARRKLSRALEFDAATKRGGRQQRVHFDAIDASSIDDDVQAATELRDALQHATSPADAQLIEHLLASKTQREIAEELNVDQRTVRRRIAQVRAKLIKLLDGPEQDPMPFSASDLSLPRIEYREFVLAKLVGNGGFGKVYRSTMQANGQTVAVKFLRKSFWLQPVAKTSLLREIQLASTISHPGIARYLGWGESPHGGPYIVGEYIDGRSLAELADVSEVEFCNILVEICNAISVAHQCGVVHGDLTPSNVLVAKDQRVVVTDFGFAMRLQPEQVVSNTPADLVQPGGTLGFAAPEQLSSAFGTVGPATDIYAIGGLAYWFLNGRPPHDGEDVAASLVDTISEPDLLPVDSSLGSAARLRLTRVANAGLRKAVVDRPSSVEEMLAILHEN